MTEDEKKRDIAKAQRNSMCLLMSIKCQSTRDINKCPMKQAGKECPFPEKFCKEVSWDDWVKWLDKNYPMTNKI